MLNFIKIGFLVAELRLISDNKIIKKSGCQTGSNLFFNNSCVPLKFRGFKGTQTRDSTRDETRHSVPKTICIQHMPPNIYKHLKSSMPGQIGFVHSRFEQAQNPGHKKPLKFSATK